MVKRKSSLVSTEVFQVRILVGLLIGDKRKGNPMGDGTRLEAGRARALRVRIPLLPLFELMVSVVYEAGTAGCEPEGRGSTPLVTPLVKNQKKA